MQRLYYRPAQKQGPQFLAGWRLPHAEGLSLRRLRDRVPGAGLREAPFDSLRLGARFRPAPLAEVASSWPVLRSVPLKARAHGHGDRTGSLRPSGCPHRLTCHSFSEFVCPTNQRSLTRSLPLWGIALDVSPHFSCPIRKTHAPLRGLDVAGAGELRSKPGAASVGGKKFLLPCGLLSRGERTDPPPPARGRFARPSYSVQRPRLAR